MTDTKEGKGDDKGEKAPSKENEEEKKSSEEKPSATKEQKGKAVRWDKSVQEPARREHPTKVNLGKAVIWRELGIPAFCLVMGLCMCWSLGTWGKNPPKQGKDPLEAMNEYLEYKIEDKYKKRGNNAPNCALFLAKSTLPGASYSLFAGRDIDEGDIVLPAGDFLPADLPDGKELLIQQYAFHLKYHHVKANVDGRTFWNGQGSNEGFDLRATKPIQAGSELLIPFASHPKSQLGPTSSLFEDIPTEEDFSLAEGIIKDTVESFPKRKGRIILGGSEIDKRVQLVSKVTGKLYPKILNFLPTDREQLKDWMESFRRNDVFATAVLKEKTRKSLEMNAQCVSYAKPDADSRVAIATRQFAKGSIIIPSPLLLVHPSWSSASTATIPCDDDTATNEQERQECVATDSGAAVYEGIAKSNCWQESGLPFLICPSSVASKVEFVDTTSERKPNVKFQWSSWNPRNAESHALPVDEAMKNYASKLAMDVVALSAIQEGEQLVADSGAVAAILPAQWKASIA